MKFIDRNDGSVFTLSSLLGDWKRLRAEDPANYPESFKTEMLECLMATVGGRNDLELVGLTPSEAARLIVRLRRRFEMEKAPDLNITITRTDGNFTAGTCGGYSFEIKHFENPSRFGIDGGRISKLWITRTSTYGIVAAYDRGWDRLPFFDRDIKATMAIINRFN